MNYRRAVGNKPGQEVFAAREAPRLPASLGSGPGRLRARGACELASSTGVSLYDANSIGKWIRQVDKLARERAKEEQPTRSGARDAGDERAMEDASEGAAWHPHPDDPT